MFWWILHYLIFVVYLLGFLWFCVLRQASFWALIPEFERIISFARGIFCFVLILLIEVMPHYAPLYGAPMPKQDWQSFLFIAGGAISIIWLVPLIILSAAKEQLPPRIDSKTEDAKAIGWLVSFGQIRDCQMMIEDVNYWVFRYFSLWCFESGLIVRHIETGGTNWGLKLRLVLRRTSNSTLEEFRKATKRILSTFKEDLEAACWDHREISFLRNYPTSHQFQGSVQVAIHAPQRKQSAYIPLDI